MTETSTDTDKTQANTPQVELGFEEQDKSTDRSIENVDEFIRESAENSDARMTKLLNQNFFPVHENPGLEM